MPLEYSEAFTGFNNWKYKKQALRSLADDEKDPSRSTMARIEQSIDDRDAV